MAAILLAAGESARMGRPKALLSWDGKPLLRHQVDALLDGGADSVTVVLGPATEDAGALLRGLSSVGSVLNRRAPEGKTTSVRLGVAEAPAGADSLLLLAVDQPRTAALLQQTIDAHTSGDALITHPVYAGRGGHPIIFDASLRPELLAVDEEREGIRDVVRRHRDSVQRVAIDNPMVRLDLNTMADYEAAVATYAGGR